MATLTIKLPPHEAQTEFNLRRWDELLANSEVAKIEGRVETDRFGHAVISPLAAPKHGFYQAEIGFQLGDEMRQGQVLFTCPVSTSDGVRAADVAWVSPQRIKELGNLSCFPHAPEICVEVLSPGNSDAEIEEKIALYFEAGAGEVWICGIFGDMKFFSAAGVAPMPASKLCPKFPARIELGLDS
jgi:Uma2 family endonuclease